MSSNYSQSYGSKALEYFLLKGIVFGEKENLFFCLYFKDVVPHRDEIVMSVVNVIHYLTFLKKNYFSLNLKEPPKN